MNRPCYRSADQNENLHSPPTLEVLAQVVAALPGFRLADGGARMAMTDGGRGGHDGSPRARTRGTRRGWQPQEGVEYILQGRGARARFVPQKSCRRHRLVRIALARS